MRDVLLLNWQETKANRGEAIHPGSHLGGDRARIGTGGVEPGSLHSGNVTEKCAVGWRHQGWCMRTSFYKGRVQLLESLAEWKVPGVSSHLFLGTTTFYEALIKMENWVCITRSAWYENHSVWMKSSWLVFSPYEFWDVHSLSCSKILRRRSGPERLLAKTWWTFKTIWCPVRFSLK